MPTIIHIQDGISNPKVYYIEKPEELEAIREEWSIEHNLTECQRGSILYIIAIQKGEPWKLI